jgi:cell division septum initiation protein DivIVA
VNERRLSGPPARDTGAGEAPAEPEAVEGRPEPEPGGAEPSPTGEERSRSAAERLERNWRNRRRQLVKKVEKTSFPVVMRGYERGAVDAYVADVRRLVEAIESTQSTETVIRRALDEVGEETSGILQRAHEAADEIAARSRSQSEGRLQRSRREAGELRREADEYVSSLDADTDAIWHERARLLEELRELADQLAGVAEEADRRYAPAEETEPTAMDAAGPGPADSGGPGPEPSEPPTGAAG